MAQRVYATAAQVEALVGIVLPAETAHIALRRASTDVDKIVRGARYEHDDNGPTGETAELFALMVAEQIAWTDETGDSTGAAAAVGGGTIGQVTLPRAQASKGSTASAGIDSLLSPRAVELAQSSELLTWHPGY